MACQGCNAYVGDTDCREELPVLCIMHHKTIVRPFYNYPTTTPYAYKDGGFYNGWTGGVYGPSKPVQGNQITSRADGDKICQASYEPDTKMAEHHDGYWLPYMNDAPPKVWASWSWSDPALKEGGWSHWGYFNKIDKDTGRMWTWIKDQPRANCGKA